MEWIDVSNKMHSLLDIGINAIQLHKSSQFHLVAVGITKNKEIIIGYPTHKTHPFRLNFCQDYKDYTRWIHAEQDLCFKARADNSILACIMVVRLHKKYETLKLARPCLMCQATVRAMQPRAKVYFTTNEETLEKF